ncbi:glycosyltransferase family 4 protein [Sphingobacterium shayense]|uniref:MraY family glycosyltransferase n=1 Tax=Sphingobacterium shayense TaxID=626343 RepID=UPI0015562D9D|nr:glycosyltransferase family 4 protein [Sphingobacterium shayense]NQD70238.1 glycosyltransferase family 4 protein [Sphingobacterium shayense]
MKYIIVLVTLFVLEVLYFRVADRFNIIDKPNERSSHSSITLRGGGVIFYFSVLLYFLLSGCIYPWFFVGLTMMTLVSFLDDIYTLSNKIRLFIHFSAVLLMAFQLQVFEMPWYILVFMFIVVVGAINAYNFMDGINGITACYSLALNSLLLIVNYKIKFVDQDFLLFVVLGILVFTFFNFRRKAKCFAGDVGSVTIAYILLFALGALIMKTQNLVFILFLSVYGIDAVWTIIYRLYHRENIFEAHRSHLYQFLGNEGGINKLLVSFSYALIQFFIGILVIQIVTKDVFFQIFFAVGLLTSLSVIYILMRNYVIRKYVKKGELL